MVDQSFSVAFEVDRYILMIFLCLTETNKKRQRETDVLGKRLTTMVLIHGKKREEDREK